MIPALLLVLQAVNTATASFYDFRTQRSTVLHDLGTIDAYLFPVSGVPDEVMIAANRTHDPLLTGYATSILDAALYFRNHPALLTSLTVGVVSKGREKMVEAQRQAYGQLIDLFGKETHLGQLLSDYAKMMTGQAQFSTYIKDALVLELERQLRQPDLEPRYRENLKKIEVEYERRMMDVMLEGTAGSRELQTPFLMMAAAMKGVHDRMGVKDQVPEGLSPNGSKLNATMPHNDVERQLMPS